MENIKLKVLILGMVHTNCYTISNTDTNQAIVIDPADNAPAIYEYLQDNNLELKAILLTHGHFDHITGALDLAGLTGVPVYAHEAEGPLLKNPDLNASGSIGHGFGLEADILLRDGEEVLLAGFNIGVIHTPGHTAGSTCYYFKDYGMLFSGDTLFYESIGRTDLPTGSFSDILTSIKNKLMLLDDDVRVYPGHGRATTIGHERTNNYYIGQER
jgi:hydroxyacylglutathione hydrolase